MSAHLLQTWNDSMPSSQFNCQTFCPILEKREIGVESDCESFEFLNVAVRTLVPLFQHPHQFDRHAGGVRKLNRRKARNLPEFGDAPTQMDRLHLDIS